MTLSSVLACCSFTGLLSANACASGVQRQPRQLFNLKSNASVNDVPRGVRVTPLQAKEPCSGRGWRPCNAVQLMSCPQQGLVAAEPVASPYDTAWVAMVPEPGSPGAPRFPQCVEWILQNQHGDGSWGFGHLHPTLAMDTLSSTLACVLALKKWGVGENHVRKGLRFIGDNMSCLTDGSRHAPVGFNIIFPGMLRLGMDMGLELPLKQEDIDRLFRLRNMELTRGADGTDSGRKAFMAYVAEGLGDLQDWNQVLPYQRKNGSLFNSPSTTAALAIHQYNHRAIGYLDFIVSKFGSSVPAAYPMNVYSRLCTVDCLEEMGISQSFAYEIKSILDMVYRLWLQNDDEIVLDVATSAKAFRLLRMHGYDVSTDLLAQFTEESSFQNTIQGYLNDSRTLMELYKASQVQILEEEAILEKMGSWSSKILNQQLHSNNVSRWVDPDEVKHALKFPIHSTLDRLEHRRNIEHFKTDSCIHMLKSAYWIRSFSANEEIAELAIDCFRSSQSLYQEELLHMESWVKETRQDELKFARLMPATTLFTAAATMFSPELSEARLAWAKSCVLATVMDDLFDVEGSIEELENLVTLLEKWDAHAEVGFCSEVVEIIFLAIYNTSKQLGEKAAALQKRSIEHHIAELWLDLARTMMTESKWSRSGYVPSMEEYMRVAEVTIALGPIVLIPLYFIGPELPEKVVRGPEYNELLRHVNICGRLLNDLQTQKKESSQGKINSVTLLSLRNGGSVSDIEGAEAEARKTIEASRRELLRIVVTETGSVVPTPCKQLFWNKYQVLHFCYWDQDGYFSPEQMMSAVKAVLYDPL